MLDNAKSYWSQFLCSSLLKITNFLIVFDYSGLPFHAFSKLNQNCFNNLFLILKAGLLIFDRFS